jgi:UTP--glucose-1-phosphate uridylyltransferase
VRGIKPANIDCFYARREAGGPAILADDLLRSPMPVMSQLIDTYNHYPRTVSGVETIVRSQPEGLAPLR